MLTYDKTRARYTVIAPYSEHINRPNYHFCTFETLNPNECKFWLSLGLGYSIDENRWNGKIFTLAKVHVLDSTI